MTRNIGSVDRAIRLIVGLFLVSLVFWGPKTAWGYLGLIPLATALVNWCPPYSLLGISTRKKSEKA